jgi:D-beta-D-heptose 7-phosphate kinase/D-beta-D-heptose 1-phosphate adenosyltransferase
MFSMLDLIVGLKNPKIIVIGDLILDRYIHGSVDRISPEGPIPVLRYDKQHDAPGGAANVAVNLQAMGAQVSLAGLLGRDTEAKMLKTLISETGVKTALCLSEQRPTSIKTRFLSQGQQLLRLDQEDTSHPAGNRQKAWIQKVLKAIGSVDLVVLSDYAKGVLSEAFLKKIFATCKSKKIQVLVDPKGIDYSRYRGATLITPNLKEAELASQIKISNDKDFKTAALVLMKITACSQILITCGANGMKLVTKKGLKHQPTQARSVYDVSGAGDSSLAALAIAWASGYAAEECMHVANLAGGIAVSRLGAHPVSRNDLLAQLDGEEERKLLSRKKLSELCETYRRVGKKVVLTTGCFDLLHTGHLQILKEAAAQGDVLVVGINTDKSIKKLASKGEDRPITDESQRAHMISGFGMVNHVVLFAEENPQKLIEVVKPDVWVKGGDYKGAKKNSAFGREAGKVKEFGGRVHLVDLVHGQSTSNLVKKIRNS